MVGVWQDALPSVFIVQRKRLPDTRPYPARKRLADAFQRPDETGHDLGAFGGCEVQGVGVWQGQSPYGTRLR